MGKMHEQKIHRKRYINGSQTYEMMSNFIREIQIKITLKYHLVPISLAKIQKPDNVCHSCGSVEKHSHMLLLGAKWFNPI